MALSSSGWPPLPSRHELQPHALHCCPSLQLSGQLDGGASYGTLAFGCNLMDLELHSNQLSGTVPDMLVSLSQLQVLNMADNRLTGT